MKKRKESWEMTQREYVEEMKAWARKATKIPPEVTIGPEISAEWHKHYVEKALSEGKLVPAKVLVEYPDLVQP